jgi:hypothetical protein
MQNTTSNFNSRHGSISRKNSNQVIADKSIQPKKKKSGKDLAEVLKEEELASISGGNCFGHYAAAYDIARTASAYSVEDTYLFYLDKNYFEIAFQKDIVKADNERRLFLLDRLPILESITKVEDYITRIIPIV